MLWSLSEVLGHLLSDLRNRDVDSEVESDEDPLAIRELH